MALQPMPTGGEAGPRDDGAVDDEPLSTGEPGQGFAVCIKVAPDGSLSVGTLPGNAEGGEGYRPAADRKEALTIALEILKADGRMPESDNQAADREFSSGYTEGM